MRDQKQYSRTREDETDHQTQDAVRTSSRLHCRGITGFLDTSISSRNYIRKRSLHQSRGRLIRSPSRCERDLMLDSPPEISLISYESTRDLGKQLRRTQFADPASIHDHIANTVGALQFHWYRTKKKKKLRMHTIIQKINRLTKFRVLERLCNPDLILCHPKP